MYTELAPCSAAAQLGIRLTLLRAEGVSSLLLTPDVLEFLTFILLSFPADGQKSVFLNYQYEIRETCEISTKFAQFCYEFCVLISNIHVLINDSNGQSYFRLRSTSMSELSAEWQEG